jgi:hypothetical protein
VRGLVRAGLGGGSLRWEGGAVEGRWA